jgi:riboflavin kinase, archaea type
MKISGMIQSGVGKGAFFTRLDWVVKQCQDILGYKPFPGTLNVRIYDEDLYKIEPFLDSADYILPPDNSNDCTARIKEVMVNDIQAAFILPNKDVRIHEKCVIEIIASHNLKKALGLKNGDMVTISFQTITTDKFAY